MLVLSFRAIEHCTRLRQFIVIYQLLDETLLNLVRIHLQRPIGSEQGQLAPVGSLLNKVGN